MNPKTSASSVTPLRARRAALDILLTTDPFDKARLARELGALARGGRIEFGAALELAEPPGIPGRPPQPELVPPRSLERRAMHTDAGRAALIHALAHIEFNAINLALDAVWRFAGLPEAFYADWLGVAAEEAYHFTLLADHLTGMGFRYGDFPAHNGLWEMAQKTSGDLLARLALVPRTLEARGLDASPPIRAKLWQAGDRRAAHILDIILRDEIGHVAVGNRWYRWCCAQQALDPLEAYRELAQRYQAPHLKGPFNLDARRAAGFDEAELAALMQATQSPAA
ncbi:ferritin-like domain-containing protein [Pandoraea sp.]|uniref:ferritin-like domain-containing protein n=1 Tax=Pandoraea sp. TaxID=1883445 RepID=UPI001215D46C|nr:ferritin-like domain-containing protein [Pandoraea sp.]TAL54808.1 MAG: ferritin-like domain-containing protein [Pandoraea sp.]TAM18424.1 MAG: ferritin-like domain-containing protein [Pandoraea sp.]